MQGAVGAPESADRRADYCISVRPSAKPLLDRAAQSRAPAIETFRRAGPDRYKSMRYCQARRSAGLITSIILQASPGLPLVCLTLPKRNRAARWLGNYLA